MVTRKSRGKLAKLLGFACIAGLAPLATAESVGLDLTAGGAGFINGAYFTSAIPQSTGSGVIDSFVRISTNQTTVQGFNTDARPLQFDENNSGTFTHDLSLAGLPTVTDSSGKVYYFFLLDINQEGSDPLFSLNEVKIYAGSAGGLLSTDTDADSTTFNGFGSDANLVYDMDAAPGGDVRVELNYNLNSGSGSGDMFLFVPKDLFPSTGFVYLFSKFGDPNGNNDGYEEWATVSGVNIPPPPPGTTPVPLPAAAWAGFALFGGLGLKRRRRLA